MPDPTWYLEGKVSSQLKIAWRTVRAGDHTKQWIAGAATSGIRVRQIGMIERIERVDLHAQAHLVMDLLRLGQRDVGVRIARADSLI